jgi:hypothetical protein
MAVSEAAMLDRGGKGARRKSGPFERSLAMGNTLEFSDVLLEPNEAAAFLKVSLSWLAKTRASNAGPPSIRIGRCVRRKNERGARDA